MTEQWRPVVGFEGYYEVSDAGRVRSLHRGGRMRSLAQSGRYVQATLKAHGESRVAKVHTLVAEAFLGPRPAGLEVCHGNGDGTDNRLENLRYDTRSANHLDTVRHGTHHQARKTHCPRNHEYTPENTAYWTRKGRSCRECDRLRRRKTAA